MNFILAVSLICAFLSAILVFIDGNKPDTSEAENWKRTIIYYSIAFPAVALFMFGFRHSGGPCTPGFDFFGFFAAGLFSISLAGKNAYLTFKDRRHKSSLILHLIVTGGWIFYLTTHF